MIKWADEQIARGIRLSYGVNRVLSQASTPHQELTLIENDQFGRVLLLDGVTQVATADEFIYHEMLAHVPLFAHGEARDVLIIGGGDCGLAEEVLRHEGVRRVFQVELDAAVVDAARRHLGAINAPVFSDQRFHLKIDDGVRFVDGLDERFDVVLVDSTDPIGPGARLFSAEFYRAIQRCLRPRGVLAVQAGMPFLQRTGFATTVANLSSVFQRSGCYLLASPSYVGGHLSLGWGSDSLRIDSVALDVLEGRIARSGLNLRYYSAAIHRAAFVLPPYIAQLLPSRSVDQSTPQAPATASA
ncbi:MAG TPA: polyamine aminopropyltransferase [Steroidobacter sp.]|uniref:polyamine aminopropyltransferase n=1 Tax=Steroidobacter sp. TaxID=1978227 RepID=UPI002EDA1986